jgi:hypothetical protein
MNYSSGEALLGEGLIGFAAGAYWLIHGGVAVVSHGLTLEVHSRCFSARLYWTALVRILVRSAPRDHGLCGLACVVPAVRGAAWREPSVGALRAGL